jgi:cytochrome c oxidase subunit 2
MTGQIPVLAVDAFLQRMFFRRETGTESVASTDSLFMLIWWFSVFFFVLLMGLMVYWTIKYRRRPGIPAPVSPSHNTPLEIFWTVVPSSALLVIFLLGFWGYMSKVTPAADAMELRIRGWKWGWAATYPNGQETTLSTEIDPSNKVYPIIVVPEDTNISLRMISQDVIHAFWIPDFRVKMDVYPNRYTGYAFQTPKLLPDESVPSPLNAEGEIATVQGRDMWVFCAEYCGQQHSQMAALIRVVPRGVFEQWYAGLGASKDPLTVGAIVHKQKCAACHTVDGGKNTGPTWLNAYGYEHVMGDGSKVLVDENYIRESILVPGAKLVQGYANQMPSFQGQLSEDQLLGVLAYMRSLSDRGGDPTGGVTPDASTESPADAPSEPAPDAAPDTTTPTPAQEAAPAEATTP